MPAAQPPHASGPAAPVVVLGTAPPRQGRQAAMPRRGAYRLAPSSAHERQVVGESRGKRAVFAAPGVVPFQ